MPTVRRKRKGSYHHGNLREAVVAAATEVVTDVGPARLTIRAVAERLGVTHAAVYHHFEDRRAMLAGVAELAFDRLDQELGRLAAATSSAPRKTRNRAPIWTT